MAQEVTTMALATATEVIPFQVDSNGVARVGGTRVTLDTVIAAFSDGATAEEIVQQYPTLSLADIYYVIGYYLQHLSEIEAYLRQRKAQRETVTGSVKLLQLSQNKLVLHRIEVKEKYLNATTSRFRDENSRGINIDISLKPEAPVGALSEVVTLHTNLKRRPRIDVPVWANIH